MKMSEVGAWFEVWQRKSILGTWLETDHYKGELVVKQVSGISDMREIWHERYW
jgi:lambda repressor-like predicted transcriptional regulator